MTNISSIQERNTKYDTLISKLNKKFIVQTKSISVIHEKNFEINLIVIAKIVSLVVSKDNRLLVSSSSDKSIKIYDIKTRKELHHWVDIQNCKFLFFTNGDDL